MERWELAKDRVIDKYGKAKNPSLMIQLLYAIFLQLDKISGQLDRNTEIKR